jgi:hypothetical protein
MALQQVALRLDSTHPVPPEEVCAYLRVAGERIDEFVYARGLEVPAFVPADYRLIRGALQEVAERRLAPEMTLCEWGSGFGVVAGMAALLGYRSWGIEFERDLVEAAEKLAADFRLPVEYACGTFVPPGGEDLADEVEEFAWLLPGGEDAYADLGLDPCDFGLIYAYPWPGEESVVEALFDRFAAAGALLLTYRGQEGLRLHRKTAARR